MKYCKRCLQMTTRPRIRFDDKGVCFACHYQEKVDNEIDWGQREKELIKIAKWAKKNSKALEPFDARLEATSSSCIGPKRLFRPFLLIRLVNI